MKKFNKNKHFTACNSGQMLKQADLPTDKKKIGFTLAEVLITLGIIGVVAALTIPTLVRNYNEYVTVNKVKKFYSTMNKAYQRSMVDNGRADEWKVNNGASNTSATQLMSYFKPYLKISKDCGTISGCLGYKNVIKYLNGMDYTNYDTDSWYYKLILADNSIMWIRSSNSTYCKELNGNISHTCGIFFYDVNRIKGPNTIGKDIFTFTLTSNGIYPTKGWNDCNKNGSGWDCSSYIIEHGNMNYLH